MISSDDKKQINICAKARALYLVRARARFNTEAGEVNVAKVGLTPKHWWCLKLGGTKCLLFVAQLWA